MTERVATDQQPSLKHGRLAWSWQGVIGDFEPGSLKEAGIGALLKLFERNKRCGSPPGIDDETSVSGRGKDPSISIVV